MVIRSHSARLSSHFRILYNLAVTLIRIQWVCVRVCLYVRVMRDFATKKAKNHRPLSLSHLSLSYCTAIIVKKTQQR